MTAGACMEEAIGLGRTGAAADHRIVVAPDTEHWAEELQTEAAAEDSREKQIQAMMRLIRMTPRIEQTLT